MLLGVQLISLQYELIYYIVDDKHISFTADSINESIKVIGFIFPR